MKPADKTVEEWEEQLESLPCSICNLNIEEEEDKLLLCDRCNRGFHIFCLDPVRDHVPKDDWFWPECVIVKISQQIMSEKSHSQEVLQLQQ